MVSSPEAGQPVDADTRKAAKATDRLRSEILDIGVDINWRPDDIKFTDYITAVSARYRAQGQAHIEPWYIAGQQQISISNIYVENRFIDQFLDVFLQEPLRRPGVSPNLN